MVEPLYREPGRIDRPYKCDYSGLVYFLQEIVSRHDTDRIMFVCIGTDRSTGDALGPLVGSKLKARGFLRVIGTLEEPCDASNLEWNVTSIPPEQIIIAIDACLGHPSAVGQFLVSNQPLLPAESVGTPLPAVGHYSIAAVVNSHGPKPYMTLQTTSLYQVMQLADQIVDAIDVTLLS